jgi:phospholipase/carboxylesterase
MIEPELLTYDKWTFRYRPAEEKPVRLLLMLHGWMGDENSMWVLAQKMPRDYAILAPRGPHPVEGGGYSWREISPGRWGKATIDDLLPAAKALLDFIEDWAASIVVPNNGKFSLMGFSQGAAMVYTLALLYPQKVQRMVALSGFIPENGEILFTHDGFSGKPVFIAHGTRDEMIHIDEAHRSIAILRSMQAQVTYCESETGHKVSKECLKSMVTFLGRP